MRLSILMLAGISLAVTNPASAQSVLPNAFTRWTAGTRGALAPSVANSAPTTDADWPVIHEYGFLSGETATYTRGADSIQVALYRMKDASGAYGEYSYLRAPEMPRADFTDHSAMSRDRALILTGNLVLDIRGNDLSRSRLDLAALV